MSLPLSGVNNRILDQTIDKVIKDIPIEFLKLLKEHFEKSLPNFMGTTLKLELKLIVDSSSVISNMLSFIKRGESFLHKLINEPFLKLFAPSALRIEVERYISKMPKNKEVEKELLRKTWIRDILPHITILEPTNFDALFEGNLAIGSRDPNDVPFAALSFQLKAHGIITQDKDMTEQQAIKTWRLGGVSSLISVFKKGSFSFFVFSKMVPGVLRAMFELGVAILQTMLKTLGEIAKFIMGLADGTIKVVSKLPDWAKLVLGLGVIILVFDEKARNAVLGTLSEIGKSLAMFASEFFTLIKGVLEISTPIIEVAISVLTFFQHSYQDAITQLGSL